jgi:hypothetical protein
MMKKIPAILYFGVAVMLWLGCKGSEAYRGLWHATRANGTTCDVEFTEDSIHVIEQGKRLLSLGYSQHQYKNDNGVISYGIQSSDGMHCTLKFGKKGELNYLMMLNEGDYLIHLMCREKHLDLQETLGIEIPNNTPEQ